MTEEVKENAKIENEEEKGDLTAETTPEATDIKEGEQEEDTAVEDKDDEDAQKEEDKPVKKGFRYRDGANATGEEHANSPYLRIKNRHLINALSESLEKSQASLKEIFTDKLEVAIPKVKLPMVMHLYVEMASLEDKLKVLSNTLRPERWNSNKKLPPTAVISQSVVVRKETIPEAEQGTLEEALEELLPLRKMLYKDQLNQKFKDLDLDVDNAVAATNVVLAKDKRKKPESIPKLNKPPVDSIVPMVPNVGYDRNVVLNLEKDAAGKIIPGIRVIYEKDGVKKRYLLPVSECTHIAPQIVKAAEELCAQLSTGNVKVFDGIEESPDIFSLKFTMNDIGEIILSVVLALHDHFDEFYNLMDNDAVPKEVTDYFDLTKSKDKRQIIKEAKENGGDVAELNGVDDEAIADEEEEEKMEESIKTSETKDDSAPPTEEEEEKKEEEKKDDKAKADDDDINILRESTKRPIKLKLSPLLSRMEPVMREQITRFTPELKKFFDEKCSTLGVTGIFITWYVVNELPTDFSRNFKHWYHVCGNECVTETVNNVKLELVPHLEMLHPSRPQVVPTIMNILTDALGIDNNSRAVVASDYHMVQNFFAQKCNKTMFLTYLNEGLKNDVKKKHREGVMYVSAKTKHTNIIEKCKGFFSDLPNVVVHWGAYREHAIKALFVHRVAKVAIIFDPQENVIFRNQSDSSEIIKKLNCSLHPQYTLKKVIGIDVGPLKKGPVTVIAIYETVPGFFNANRGIKRKGSMYGGPNANKRQMQGNKQMNDRRRGGGGMGGGGYGNKRPRMDDGNRRPPQPLLSARGGGPNRSRFNQRPPHPWNDNRRFEPYNGRGGGGFNNQGGPQEPTVQAAKAVLSQLNSIIENQLMLAQIKSGPDPNQSRGRPEEGGGGGWISGGGSSRRDNYGANRDGPSNFANDQDYFSRDRSPPAYGGGGNRGFNDNRGGGGGGYNDNSGRNYGGGGGNMNRNFGGGDSGRGFGGGDMNRRAGGGGMGGGGGGMNRRNMGGGGGGGGASGGAGKPFRQFNNRRN